MEARLVLIDNDKLIQNPLVHNLQHNGYEVFGYDYEQIDLASLEQVHPDLIILDFNAWDHGNGWNFLQMLKIDEATAEIPILIISTAYHFSTELEGYLAARYIRVVANPFDPVALLQLIQQTLTLASQSRVLFASDQALPILVVEDEKTLREAVTAFLGFAGYQVATARNGRQALDAVYRADHCVILLDLDMPIMNGFEFLKTYEKQPRPHSPVILISGDILSDDEHIFGRVLPSFVVDMLPKPFEFKRLLQTLEKYARRV